MKMKKVRINKYFRTALIGAAGVLGIAAAFLIVKEYQSEHTREEKKTIYEYSLNSDVSYKVHVKPNILYEEEELAEGQMYLTEFVDYITADFASHFTGSGSVDIEGDYRIEAEVRGYTTKEEQKQIIWQKEFEIVPEEHFNKTSDKHSLKKEVKINFPEYNRFAQSVLEASKVNLSVELVVRLIGSQTMAIPKGGLNDALQTAITIPLNNGYFNITKEGATQKSDVVEEVTKIPTKVNKDWIIICSGLIGMSVLSVIGILIFTGVLNAEDLKKNKIKKILNEHGSRMVVVDQMRISEGLEIYRVNTIEDLIKIADEIEKPVFYQQQDNLLDKTKFYVKEQNNLYIFEIKEEEKIVREGVIKQNEQTEEDIIASPL
ncbi:MAG: hypothetical protein K0S30_95 [Clostridia bacterium]|jgi:hypothetical protein|nr:hypothetical protein [Clostridia bacterium]